MTKYSNCIQCRWNGLCFLFFNKIYFMRNTLENRFQPISRLMRLLYSDKRKLQNAKIQEIISVFFQWKHLFFSIYVGAENESLYAIRTYYISIYHMEILQFVFFCLWHNYYRAIIIGFSQQKQSCRFCIFITHPENYVYRSYTRVTWRWKKKKSKTNCYLFIYFFLYIHTYTHKYKKNLHW